MSITRKPKARLIALEGSGGRSMAVAAKQLERGFRREKVIVRSSAWDDSDLFFQISQGTRGLPAPSAQTLVLLYATDLVFRLRWQIQPALEEGISVIAVPYLETVFGFGRGAGLSPAWLRGVFEFAPPASECYRVPEDSIPLDRRGTPANSFLEFCLAQLRGGPASWDAEEIRRGFLAHLARLEARGRCRLATGRPSTPAAPAR
jgi:hypothetical protein